MADNELLLKINADAKNAIKAFDDVKAKTEDLDEVLSKVAKVSAVAFAAFTGEILLSSKAFDEAEQASRELTNALQNQGIYTEKLAEQYKEYAAELQKVTGIDDDAIISAQALAQTYLGQTEITKELSKAIVDFAAYKKIDVAQSAEILAKSIGTETNVLARSGLQFAATATEAEKYAKVIEFVNIRAGDLAEQNNKGLGSLKGLQSAFGDFQEEIGKTFAPVLEKVIGFLTRMFQFFKDSPTITAFATAFILVGTAVSGIALGLAAVGAALPLLTAGMAAFGVTTNVALGGLPIIIAGIAAGVVILTATLRNSDAALKDQSKTAEESTAKITKLEAEYAKLQKRQEDLASSAGSGKEFSGGTDVNFKRLEQVRKQIEAEKKLRAELEAKADVADPVQAAKTNAADKEAADKRARAQLLRDIEANNIEIIKLQNEGASAELIALKQKENAILKSLGEQKSAEEKELLRAQYEETVALEEEQRAQDNERRLAYLEEDAAARQELIASQQNAAVQLTDAQRAELEKRVLTEKQIEQKALLEAEQARIDARNREIEMRKKYGVTIAAIDEILHSSQVAGAKQISGELVGLAQSKNSTLASIGKAAAVTQITIATAESAVKVAQSVIDVLPFPINIPVAVALAGARVAYGAEQIGNVIGAAEGGLITGGIPGVDSVPVLAQEGELVAPRSNFEEVVGGVQRSRASRDDEIVELLTEISSKQKAGDTYVFQGDMLAEESYMDRLVKGVSDALEFRNGKIFGVNT